ncbi:sensor histidine kinase [Spongisporangium articulatum]|uniref:histidine kinase n=1 Tax=Spongisporangium articulatum TaxID=3362603 RepID=A0ABW8AWB0_9ACTN
MPGKVNSTAARLLVVIIAVTAFGSIVGWVVGALIAPRIFHHHLHNALPQVATGVLVHADEAFTTANSIAFAVSLLAALLFSAILALYLSRRLSRTLGPLTEAASEVAAGRYDVRVETGGLGPEVDDVVIAFNDMAARLERDERTRSRLLADVAHELRTPVATIEAYIEGILDGVVELDASTAAVLTLQIARIARLTDDMAAVSWAEADRPRPEAGSVDPARLVESAVLAAGSRFEAKGVHLLTTIEPTPTIRADAERLGQVLGNLLDNALRHTPPTGAVTIATWASSERVHLSVTDTGDGILAEHQPLIFDRFYRVDTARDRLRGGSGIGLAIAKSLVEANGGRISVVSDGPGLGSTFTLEFPIENTSEHVRVPSSENLQEG